MLPVARYIVVYSRSIGLEPLGTVIFCHDRLAQVSRQPPSNKPPANTPLSNTPFQIRFPNIGSS